MLLSPLQFTVQFYPELISNYIYCFDSLKLKIMLFNPSLSEFLSKNRNQYRFGAQKIDQKYPVTLVKFSVHFQTRSMRLCAR